LLQVLVEFLVVQVVWLVEQMLLREHGLGRYTSPEEDILIVQ
jgi:hypothetical protein